LGFIVYKPRGERQEKQPIISLSKTSIVLNNISREKLNSTRVELAYNQYSKMMRIRAVQEGGMEIKISKLFAKGFYNAFKINKQGKFPATYDEAQNALFVQL
jgi:hypothetical protein